MMLKRPDVEHLRQHIVDYMEEFGTPGLPLERIWELLDYIEALEWEMDSLKDAQRRDHDPAGYVAWARLWKQAAKDWYMTARDLDEALSVAVDERREFGLSE